MKNQADAKNLTPYVFLFLAQFFVAFNIILNKLSALNQYPFTFSTIRYLMSFVVQSMIFIIYKKIKKQPLKIAICNLSHPDTRYDFYMSIAQAFVGGMLFSVLFYSGLKYTTATSASIISATFPAILTILGVFLLGDRIDFKKGVAIVLSMVGILALTFDSWITIFSHSENNPKTSLSLLGDLLIFISMFPEAMYSILARKVRGHYSYFETSLFVVFFCFFFMLPFSLYEIFTQGALNSINGQDLQLLFWAGQTSTLYFIFWPAGVVKVSSSVAGLFGAVVPVAATILATFILHEELNPSDMLGMALVIFAIFLGSPALMKRITNIFS